MIYVKSYSSNFHLLIADLIWVFPSIYLFFFLLLSLDWYSLFMHTSAHISHTTTEFMFTIWMILMKLNRSVFCFIHFNGHVSRFQILYHTPHRLYSMCVFLFVCRFCSNLASNNLYQLWRWLTSTFIQYTNACNMSWKWFLAAYDVVP